MATVIRKTARPLPWPDFTEMYGAVVPLWWCGGLAWIFELYLNGRNQKKMSYVGEFTSWDLSQSRFHWIIEMLIRKLFEPILD